MAVNHTLRVFLCFAEIHRDTGAFFRFAEIHRDTGTFHRDTGPSNS